MTIEICPRLAKRIAPAPFDVRGHGLFGFIGEIIKIAEIALQMLVPIAGHCRERLPVFCRALRQRHVTLEEMLPSRIQFA